MISRVFKTTFGYGPAVTGFTPGRVNLIGEHTDYNGGMVLPTALELGVTLAVGARSDNSLQIWSDKFEGITQRDLTETSNNHWSDYVLGAVKLALSEGLISSGMDIAIQTTLPFGAGISSSAAVTVGVLKLLRDMSDENLSDEDIAGLAQRVENEFIGMPCGIMDQMAVSIAHPGQALALQTDTLQYELVKLPQDYHMAVIHSGVFRQLNEGRYKERKEECDIVKAVLGHDNICQISDTEFGLLDVLSDTARRRARHCMTEHRRTIAATECLKANDLETFGQLMIESHQSMRDDFEITVPEIDDLVASAVGFGALGARMTGGGFGGCIVACVPSVALDSWREQLLAKHTEAFWVA